MNQTALKTRLQFLDLAKTLAIISMLYGHASITFNPNTYRAEGYQGHYAPIDGQIEFWTRLIRNSFTEMFLITSGFLIALLWHSQGDKIKQSRLTSKIIKRCLLIILFDVVFTAKGFAFAGGQPIEMKHVQLHALTSVGAGGILAILCLQYLPPYLITILPFGALLTSFFTANSPMPNAPTAIQIIHSAFISGEPVGSFSCIFPIIRWWPATLIGVLLGRYFFKAQQESSTKKFWTNCRNLGLSLIASFIFYRSIALSNAEHTEGFLIELFKISKFPPGPEYFLWHTGVCIIGIYVANKISAYISESNFFIFGRQALFIWPAHLILIGVFRAVTNRTVLTEIQILMLVLPYLILSSYIFALMYEKLKRQYVH